MKTPSKRTIQRYYRAKLQRDLLESYYQQLLLKMEDEESINILEKLYQLAKELK